MQNLVIALTGLALLWGLSGCAYPDTYYNRSYSSGYYTQSYPYPGSLYSRTYVPPIFAHPDVAYYTYSPYGRAGLHRTWIYYGPAVKYYSPRLHGRHLHDYKARHRLTHPGHGKHFPGHPPGFHDGKRHHGKHHGGKDRHVGRRIDNRHSFGPTIPVRVDHGISIEHPKHGREKFRKSPRHERHRHDKPGFAAHGGHRAPAVRLSGSKQHGDHRSDHQLRSERSHRRLENDKAGFKAKRRSPAASVEFRGRVKQDHDRVRIRHEERRDWRNGAFERGSRAKFCAGQRC